MEREGREWKIFNNVRVGEGVFVFLFAKLMSMHRLFISIRR